MSEWQQSPMTPHQETNQAGYTWIQELPHLPTELPQTPPRTPDRPAIGLERFLSPNGSPLSQRNATGFVASTREVNPRDMTTGRSASPSPPRSLLSRLREVSQTQGE